MTTADMSSQRGSLFPIPFNTEELDSLMEDQGIDVLVVTSKHNIQYLLGGYKYFFFESSDAIGLTRYLPILIYPKSRPEQSVYIGNAMEDSELENGRFWCKTVETKSWGTLDAIKLAVDHLDRLGLTSSSIGAEFSFMPADAMDALRSSLPQSRFIEAHFPLERLRAVKSPAEMSLIRTASELVVDSMLATFAKIQPGDTKHDVVSRLRKEEVARGLQFEYCLMTAGTGFNRAPSNQIIKAGDIISLDSGGRFEGYIGDLCRMGIVGEADEELRELLSGIEDIQQIARQPIRSGALAKDILAAGFDLIEKSAHRDYTHFVAHGVGIVPHEAPRISDRGPVSYSAYDADLPLRMGMVISIETTLLHPKRGFIKLEDTLLVTENGWEACGDGGRGWNASQVNKEQSLVQ